MNYEDNKIEKTFKSYFSYNIKISIFSFAFIISIIFMNNCSNSSEESENNHSRLIPSVEAVQAHYGSLPLSERLTGVVKARNQVEIYPEISAAIVSVYVHNGDVVKKGQPMVRLRDKEFQDRLKQAKANYQIAIAQSRQAEARLKEVQADLKRKESLANDGLASSADLETAQTQAISAEANFDLSKARVEQSHAAMEESKVALSETVIRAAVSGTVGNRNAEVGMLVNPNKRLFTLGQLDNLKIEIVLTDRMLNYIETGQRTEISADYLPSGVLEAPLTRISPFLHPVTHSTDAEIDVKNPGGNLKPGMFVTVDVYYGESEQATLLPLSALYENPSTGVTGVFVSNNSLLNEPSGGTGSDKVITLTNPVLFKFVTVDIIARGRMEAGVSGVDPQDWVVTLGQNLLGADSSKARVHTVKWNWVEKLQNMQSEDLLKEIMTRQQMMLKDSTSAGHQ